MNTQQTWPCEKIIPYEVVGANKFTVKNNTLLYTVDYYCTSLIKTTDGLSADSLIRAVKIVFEKFGLPKKIVSDAGINFISDKFRHFYRQLNIEQAHYLIIPSPEHQMGRSIIFMKCTIIMPG